MSRFLLIRHAAAELAANLIGGRSPGIHLSAGGNEQACRLALMLRAENIRAIYASPRERARETAQPIAEDRSIAVEIAPELDEIDYGDWTGLSMEELSARPQWQAFNTIRSCTRIPGGELIAEVQARVTTFYSKIARTTGKWFGSPGQPLRCDSRGSGLLSELSSGSHAPAGNRPGFRQHPRTDRRGTVYCVRQSYGEPVQ